MLWSAVFVHLFIWAVVAYSYSKLPEIVSTHFNFKGEADHYGGKGVLFFLACIALVLTIIFIALSRVPHVYNYPVKITESNALRLYIQGMRLMLIITLLLNLMFLSLEIMMANSMANPQLDIPVWQVLIPVTIFLPVLFYYIRRMNNADRMMFL